MNEMTAWPMIGLIFGTALGFAGWFGGFGAFVVVLLIGGLGFLAGRAVAGQFDIGEFIGALGERRKSSS